MNTNQQEISEEKIIELSHEIESFMQEFCDNNDMSFLEMAALFLARLGRISRDLDQHSYFIRLLKLTELTISENDYFNKTPSKFH